MAVFDQHFLPIHWQKWRIYRHLALRLRQWGVPIKSQRTPTFNSTFIVNRFLLWPYWRPLTIKYYERKVAEYRGPHIPIAITRLEHSGAVEAGYNPHSYSPHYCRRYVASPFYAVLPDFVLNDEWPAMSDWRWWPGVRISESLLRDLVVREWQSGGIAA